MLRSDGLLRGNAWSAPLLADRLAPALLFASLAILRAASVRGELDRGPAEPSASGQLVYLLDAAHGGLAALFCGLVALLFLVRREPLGSRAGPAAVAVALAGTFGLSLLVAHPPTTRDWRVLALADCLLIVGLAVSIYAAASLRHCFGLAAEARGLVTSGAYRLVRHPLYLGELVVALGALLPVLAPLSVLSFGLFCALQASRAVLEERALMAALPDYAAYRHRTPALVPRPRPPSLGRTRAGPRCATRA